MDTIFLGLAWTLGNVVIYILIISSFVILPTALI